MNSHKEDNYLACTYYESRVRTKENPEFVTFIHNEHYYFALIDHMGDVLLRSESYTTAAARDNGITSVIRNRKDPSRYKIIDWHGAFFVKLFAENNKEIARSCPSNQEDSAALIKLLTLAAADNEITEESAKTNVVDAVDQAEKSVKGFNWWWLILVFMAIVIGALWFRSCNTGNLPGTAEISAYNSSNIIT